MPFPLRVFAQRSARLRGRRGRVLDHLCVHSIKVFGQSGVFSCAHDGKENKGKRTTGTNVWEEKRFNDKRGY